MNIHPIFQTSKMFTWIVKQAVHLQRNLLYQSIINPSRQERAYQEDSKSKDTNVYVQLKIQNVRRNWLIY